MKNKLHIQNFIESHPGYWEELLSKPPYCVSVSRDTVCGRNLMLFKYSQIDSDFDYPLVRECRGLILDADTNEVVCYPFDKFGNYGESYCPDIDWSSCYVTEKLDGSLIKVVKINDGLLVSTNGTINAFKANLAEQIGCTAENFGELVLEAVKNQHAQIADGSDYIEWFKSLFEEGKTYMFELTSPFNKVVVTWHETKLNFIGCRDNVTGKEIFFGDHALAKIFNTPKVFPLRSVDECVAAASELDCNAEGYVVVDKNFNRVKIKSPLYVAIHHLRGEGGAMSYRRALEIVKKNEVAEVLTYFPEYKSAFDDLSYRFNAKVKELEDVWNEFISIKSSLNTRKDQAIWLTTHCKTSGLLFSMLDGKIQSIHDGLYNMPNESILKMLGYKDLK